MRKIYEEPSFDTRRPPKVTRYMTEDCPLVNIPTARAKKHRAVEAVLFPNCAAKTRKFETTVF